MAEEEEPFVMVEMGDVRQVESGAVTEPSAADHTGNQSINLSLLMRNLYFDEQTVDAHGRDDKLDGESRQQEESGGVMNQVNQVAEYQRKGCTLPELRPEENKDQGNDFQKAHRSTPDFPEALYELLCSLQEGRRLNDQRCSFTLETVVRRRRCHSEPNTNKPANRVVFSSMTSLTREEFFELVATAQARRLDDQRALLGRSRPSKPKSRSFRGSIKQISFVKKPAPLPVSFPKEDLYDMILTSQAQGRLEEQRSRAPGPMDDEDFFSLLLKVQGGRMEEQRTELPVMLHT